MGIRGEIFSTRVQLQNRTYFFNVKENRMGDLYLNIVESKNRESGGFERQSVILFAEDLAEFLAGFDESLQVLERQVREKRRNKSALYRVNRDYEEGQSERGPSGRHERGKGSYVNRGTYTSDSHDRERDLSYRKSRPVKIVRPQGPWEEY
ncbi:MAG: DUF3276 family protein [Treponema sp.]|jgi:hypothetical protein|nr:DUF3276 family protein [Treponema sp.]